MGSGTSSEPKDVPIDEACASLQQETGSNHAATQQERPKRARQEGPAAAPVGPLQLSEQAAAACAAGKGIRCKYAKYVAGMAAGMATWPDIFKPDQPAKAQQEHYIADLGSAYCRLELEFMVSVHAQEALASLSSRL